MEHGWKLNLKEQLSKLGPLLQKLKYPALVLLLGLALLLIPGKSKQPDTEAVPEPTEAVSAVSDDEQYRRQTQIEMARILSQIDGAGKVSVMLTLRAGSSVTYQTDFENSSQTGEGVSTTARQTTVILQKQGAYDEAAVVKTEYPLFCGALVVSEGADDPTVRLALMNAVSALLGLGTDKITVVKMK